MTWRDTLKSALFGIPVTPGKRPGPVLMDQGFGELESAIEALADDVETALAVASGATPPDLLPVRVLTTSNVSTSTGMENGDTIDGVVVAAGDRVAKAYNGTSGDISNGIWIVSASGAASRATDADDADDDLYLRKFTVSGGTHAGETWQFQTHEPEIGTTALVIGKVKAPGGYEAEVIAARGAEDSLADRLAIMDSATLPAATPDETYRATLSNKAVPPASYGIALNARIPMVMAVDPVTVGGRLLIPTELTFDLYVRDGIYLDTGEPFLDATGTSTLASSMVVKVTTDRVDLYFRSGKGGAYVNWVIRRTTASERNADIWSTRGVWEAARDGDVFTQGLKILADPSELETAIMLDGKANFIGGNLHGNEEMTAFRMHVDGVKVNHAEPAIYEPSVVEFFMVSDMFEPGSTEETTWAPKGQKVMECWKHWTFTQDDGAAKLVIEHYIEHVVDGFSVDLSYFGMVPVERLSSVDNTTQITAAAARSPKFVEEDVSYTGHAVTADTSDCVKVYGDRYAVTCQPSRGWTSPGRSIRIDNSAAYNKVYPNFFGGEVTDDAAPWSVQTLITIQIKD